MKTSAFFKRSINYAISYGIFQISACFSIISIVAFEYKQFESGSILLGISVAFALISMLFKALLPPNFEYSIQVTNMYIVFCFSEDDCRKLSRNFYIQKNSRYLILKDEVAVIKIFYDKAVLDFLKNLQQTYDF